MRSKYNNRKTELDGIKFASKLEAKYYLLLKTMLQNGLIRGFEMQVPFVLIPTVKRPGMPAVRGVKYFADFVVTNLDGSQEVIDAKGRKTPVYQVKKKLMLSVHGIDVKEVK